MANQDHFSPPGDDHATDSTAHDDDARHDGLADDEMLVALTAGEAETGDEFIEYERAADDTLIEHKFKVVKRPRAPDALDLTDRVDAAPAYMADTRAAVGEVVEDGVAAEAPTIAETSVLATYRFGDHVETVDLPPGYHEATGVFARALIPESLPDPQMAHVWQMTAVGATPPGCPVPMRC